MTEPPWRSALAQGTKVERGQFYTTHSPFDHPAFRTWLASVPPGQLLEPFAGANNLIPMVNTIDPRRNGCWTGFDIAPCHRDVIERDVLADFPTEVSAVAVVTNPPYLAKNMARRKGFNETADRCGHWSNLYLRCLELCLEHVGYVAAIVPDSFVTARTLTGRLTDLITVDGSLFEDTEVPVCVALFTPNPAPHTNVWRGREPFGTLEGCLTVWDVSDAARAFATKATISFNAPDGTIGLRACDTTAGQRIAFVDGASINTGIGPSTRYVTRIRVDRLAAHNVRDIINTANAILEHKRAVTGDFGLTSFRGRRTDSQYRRRIDYRTARNVIAETLVATGHVPAPTEQLATRDRKTISV